MMNALLLLRRRALTNLLEKSPICYVCGKRLVIMELWL